jgi:hypothetical protein
MKLDEYKQGLGKALKVKIGLLQDENKNIDLMATRFKDMMMTLEVIGETNQGCHALRDEEMSSLTRYLRAMVSKTTDVKNSNMIRIRTIEDNLKAMEMVERPPMEEIDTESVEDSDMVDMMEEYDQDAPDFDAIEE